MPERIDDIDEVIDRIDIDETGPENIRTLNDAATLMGLKKTASNDEIRDRFRELTGVLHPDVADEDTTEVFIAIQRARDLMVDEAGEGRAQRAREAAQETEESASTAGHGFGDWVNEQREVREDISNTIQLGFMEDFTGKDLSKYDTVDDAVSDGAIELSDIARATNAINREFGVEGVDLEEFANTVASLMMSGAVDVDFRDDVGEDGFYSKSRGDSGGFYSSSSSGHSWYS